MCRYVIIAVSNPAQFPSVTRLPIFLSMQAI
jgi:hypothetical protein